MTRLLTLASVSTLAAVGCASIIGLDEYTVAKGSGGKAGAAGRAGSSAGGEGGLGEGGLPGEGGTGGVELPAVVGCDGKTGFTPNEDIVRSCLMRAGCDPTFGPVRTISTCVSYNTQAALPGESCNLGSKTCSDYEACEHGGVAHDDLCGGSQVTRCEGDKAINCGNYDGDDRFTDCDAVGGTCAVYNYPGNHLDYAECKLDISPETCTGFSDDTLFYCHSATGQDDLRYYCWEGEAYGSSCSSLATCIDSPDEGEGGATATGNASCYFDTTSCTTPATPTCNNGTATVCSDGALFKYNCGSVGLACSISSSSEYCLAPGCKAADVDTKCEESCSDDGSSLTFCYGGAPYTVKCSDYGFTQCLTGTDTDTQKVFAACRF